MRQCPKCGNANNDFDASCSFCGYQFEQAGDIANSTQTGGSGSFANDSGYTNTGSPASNANSNPGSNPGNNSGSSNAGGYTNYNGNSDYSNNGGYTPYYQNTTPFPPKTNSFALASLILGIVSIPLMCCCVGVITAILAIIFGFMARNKIATSNGTETGSGMALAGIIIGFAVIGIGLIFLIIALSGNHSGGFWQQYNDLFREEFQRQMERQNQIQ